LSGQIGLRPTLLIGVAGSVLAAALLLLTPVPKLKQTEQAIALYAVE
jgi:predicted exporter